MGWDRGDAGFTQVAAGELTPGITATEYAARRRALAASMPVGALAVLAAAPTVYMTGVIPYPYRQHADFLYLTGLTQPGAAMTLHRTGDGGEHVYQLFVPDRSPNSDLWNGWRLNRASAEAIFGAHQSYFAAELAQHVRAERLPHTPRVVSQLPQRLLPALVLWMYSTPPQAGARLPVGLSDATAASWGVLERGGLQADLSAASRRLSSLKNQLRAGGWRCGCIQVERHLQTSDAGPVVYTRGREGGAATAVAAAAAAGSALPSLEQLVGVIAGPATPLASTAIP